MHSDFSWLGCLEPSAAKLSPAPKSLQFWGAMHPNFSRLGCLEPAATQVATGTQIPAVLGRHAPKFQPVEVSGALSSRGCPTAALSQPQRCPLPSPA